MKSSEVSLPLLIVLRVFLPLFIKQHSPSTPIHSIYPLIDVVGLEEPVKIIGIASLPTKWSFSLQAQALIFWGGANQLHRPQCSTDTYLFDPEKVEAKST